ncbi:hypothetical protein WI31_04535 (plasmid) [Burkholderia ubonensis]|nr:hypothetical protein WI31_04535 [Burkholderia ubonensis]KUZ46214.1 hypothetical protein WI33_24765 [Burkholderia ubonensis]
MTVLSNRGPLVRTLTYNRQVANAGLDERIERTVHSPAGFAASRIDARLFSAGGTPNFSYVSSLTGRVLRTDSVDAGVTVTLADVDGRPAWARDARGTTAEWTYDPLGRPLSAKEANGGAALETRDRWIYGEGEPDAQAHNLRGQCVRRYDTAGRLASSDFTLTGQPLDQTRRLLADPEATPNWSGDNEATWMAELDATAYPTTWAYDATGTWFTQTDAKGNVQARAVDVAGRLKNCSLRLDGGEPQPVLSAIDYSAAGQVLSETAGNGVITRCDYEPETQRLIGLTTTRPARASCAPVLQDLHYTYDPVGNILSARDDAQATTYWRNQKVEPTRAYTYDALYQLISATGREMVNRGQQGTELPKPIIPLPKDDSVYTNYTRAYAYDRGGNLTQIKHRGAVNYTQEIVVSDRSNHALQQNADGTIKPAGVDDGSWFDQSGNQRMLLPDRLQPLRWNDRNRLAAVTLVPRNGLQDDRETYQYGADGMRVRKQTTWQTFGTVRTSEVITLPGLTLRVTRSGDGVTLMVVEALYEIRLSAGRASARALHWETGLPHTMKNDALRFGHGDLIGSTGLELGDDADLISWEEYYPYGGTAVWTARSQAEAETKFVRYSGKERDATGLVDYGWRAYQPWLARWLNPDPAGTVDGLNLYRMVRNNPVTYLDTDGRMPRRQPAGANPEADAAASSYEPETFQRRVSRAKALATRVPLAQAIYKKVAGFDIQAYQDEEQKYSKVDHLKLIEIASEKAIKYSIGAPDVAQALGKYEELAREIRSEFMAELTSEERQNLSISEDISRKYSGMVGNVQDVDSYVLIEKHGEAIKSGKPITIYGVVAYIREEESAILGGVVAHPLTQIPIRLRSEAGFLPRLSNILERMEIVENPENFQLKGVGSTLTSLSMFKMVKKYGITKFETEAINPRSGYIAHKFGMKRKRPAMSS